MTHVKSKLLKPLYLITTGITVLWMYSGGVGALSGAEFMLNSIQKLGYPSYFHFLLGAAKLIGATLILVPINRYLKVFAYTGVIFELLASALSYIASMYIFPEALIPLLFFIIVVVSFYSWVQLNNLTLSPRLHFALKTLKDFNPKLVADKSFVKIYKTFLVTDDNLISLSKFRKRVSANEEREFFILKLNDKKVAITVWDLAYHHLAQGNINGQEFLITFCPVCNSGMVFNPTVNGQKLDFYVSGVYRGMMMMSDKQTNSYWDHITGECLHGLYGGEQLRILSSNQMILEKDAPAETLVAIPKLNIFQKIVRKMQNGHTWRKVPEGKFYPGFKESFEFEDNRRPEKELGLGLVNGGIARFYPLSTIKSFGIIHDYLGGDNLQIEINKSLSIPEAIYTSKSGRPQQIFMRWYGFVQTFKQVDIFK